MTEPHLRRFASATDAVASLRAGGLVAHATESLLGIAADPTLPAALDALDRLKGRSEGRGYVLVAARVEDAAGWIAPEPLALALLGRSWPAPLTVVCAAGPLAPPRVCAADGSVALRIDRHPAVAALGALLGRPWVSTSLNLAGAPPAARFDEVPAELAAALTGFFDLPPRPRGAASTLVRVRGAELEILRTGELAAADLRAVAEAAGSPDVP